MRNTLLGLMLAVTTTVPTLATAQQLPGDTSQHERRGEWRDRRGDGQQERTQQQPAQQQIAPPQQRPQGSWNGGASDGADGNARVRGGYRGENRQGWPEGRWSQVQGGSQPRSTFNETRPQQGGSGRPDRDDRRFDPRDNRGEARDGRGYTPDRGALGQRPDDNRDQARFANRGQWNRGWRGNERYDYGGYRSGNRGAFHLPRYYAPRGWNGGYRRFSIGLRLSPVLFGQNYWLDDAYEYRLPPAYGPYRWVRYYNDALLVDIRSGSVVDTVYDIFW